MVYVVVAVIVAVAVVVGLIMRNRANNDPVDSFRRQIDALSPEARRPTIDRVRRADQESDPESDDSGRDGA